MLENGGRMHALNDRLERLGGNPFTRLNGLLRDVPLRTNLSPLILSVGEPQHAPPDFLAETVARHCHLWNRYPPVAGTEAVRRSIAGWLTRRFDLKADALDPERHVALLSGTKEGLFQVAQLMVPESGAQQRRPIVLMPNPFYLVYRGAAVMAGADVIPLSATKETNFLPDFWAQPPDVLRHTALAYLSTPANPQGTIASLDYLKRAIVLARHYNFLLVVDECYSEIYDGDPPPGALKAAEELGGGFANLLVFNSLSKRSNAAGLRAGFVAGDPVLLEKFLMLRSFGAPQVPLPLQAAAGALWDDEAHVSQNRARYRAKIDAAERIIGTRFHFYRPPGGFFLWLEVGDSEVAAVRLWRDAGLKILPGLYLANRDLHGFHPAKNHIRVALVHDDDIVSEAMRRLCAIL